MVCKCVHCLVVFVKQKTAYDVRISDWSSDVCSSDLFKLPDEQAELEVVLRVITQQGVNFFAPSERGTTRAWAQHWREEHRHEELLEQALGRIAGVDADQAGRLAEAVASSPQGALVRDVDGDRKTHV